MQDHDNLRSTTMTKDHDTDTHPRGRRLNPGRPPTVPADHARIAAGEERCGQGGDDLGMSVVVTDRVGVFHAGADPRRGEGALPSGPSSSSPSVPW